MFGLPKEAIGAIVAAIIAGIIALLGLIISKEQKVSEFRQQWIDALREDVAAVIRYGHSMLRSGRKWEENSPEWESHYREDFAGVTEAMARIRLRLNPKEKESIALMNALAKHKRAIESEKEPNFDAISSAANDVVDAAQVVLKQEWVRVRSGESVYRVTRHVALLIIVVPIIALLYHMFRK
jgi:hypothetical protein